MLLDLMQELQFTCKVNNSFSGSLGGSDSITVTWEQINALYIMISQLYLVMFWEVLLLQCENFFLGRSMGFLTRFQ